MTQFLRGRKNFTCGTQKNFRGIDPDVTTGTCHDHSEVPQAWPTRREVLEFRNQVRQRVLKSLPDLLKSNHFMAMRGRTALMTSEHDLMVSAHFENV